MRDYQLAGLNWLIRLYENGINGILADEMVHMETVHACFFSHPLTTLLDLYQIVLNTIVVDGFFP